MNTQSALQLLNMSHLQCFKMCIYFKLTSRSFCNSLMFLALYIRGNKMTEFHRLNHLQQVGDYIQKNQQNYFSTFIVVKYFITGYQAAKKACHMLLILAFLSNLFWCVSQRRKRDITFNMHKINVTHIGWHFRRKDFLKQLAEFNDNKNQGELY